MGELSSKRFAILLLAAVASTLVVGGCGGDSSGEETYSVEADTVVTTGSIPMAGYVPRVNRICRKAWVTILDNWGQVRSWEDPKTPERKGFEDAVQTSLTAGIVFHIFDNIYNLGAPKGEEQEVEEIIGTMQVASERGQKKLAPIASVSDVVDLYGDYNRQAREYGFDECLVDRAHLKTIEA